MADYGQDFDPVELSRLDQIETRLTAVENFLARGVPILKEQILQEILVALSPSQPVPQYSAGVAPRRDASTVTPAAWPDTQVPAPAAPPQEEPLADGAKPWEREGISRRTWYRRLARARKYGGQP